MTSRLLRGALVLLACAGCDGEETGTLELFAEGPAGSDASTGGEASSAAGGGADTGGAAGAAGAAGACGGGYDECGWASDTDCVAPLPPHCDVAQAVCVECVDHSQCADGLRCDPALHTCEPGCRTDSDCTSTIVPRCLSTSGACVQCLTDVDCVGQFHSMCLVTQSRCEECHFDVQCPAGQACNAVEGRCH